MTKKNKTLKETGAWPYSPTHPFSIGLMEMMKEMGLKSYYLLSRKSGIPLSTCRDIFCSGYAGPSWQTFNQLAVSFDLSHAKFAESLEEKYLKKKKKRA